MVAVRGNALTPERKALTAKEFGFSATVFIHDAPPGPGQARTLDVFTGDGVEVPFEGHPVRPCGGVGVWGCLSAALLLLLVLANGSDWILLCFTFSFTCHARGEEINFVALPR